MLGSVMGRTQNDEIVLVVSAAVGTPFDMV
jgi:hypothetical protein